MNDRAFHVTEMGIAAGVVMLLVSGCGGANVNKVEFAKVKTAAVLVYTVPPTIEYRSDPKESKKSVLQAVVQAAAAGSGARAATLAQRELSARLNGKGLPFRVLTADEIQSNAAFKAIDPTSFSAKAATDDSTMGKALAMASAFAGSKNKTVGVAPDGLPQFGLPENWGDSPLRGTDDERKYLKAAIKALNVDAAIVVADVGFSFTCNACVGGTGDGSTGSAFMVAMVDKEVRPILGVQEWFGTSGGHAAMLAYAVNPLQHDSLFQSHGQYTADVFVKILQDEGVLPKK